MADVCLGPRVLQFACLVGWLSSPLAHLVITMLFRAFNNSTAAGERAYFFMRTTSRQYCETHTAIALSPSHMSYPHPVAEMLPNFPKMPQIDSEHRGPLVNIAAWTTLVAMVLIVSGKVATKWKMIRNFQADDTLIVLAMVSPESLAFKSSYAQIFPLMPISPQPSLIALPQQYRFKLAWASLKRPWIATNLISTRNSVLAR